MTDRGIETDIENAAEPAGPVAAVPAPDLHTHEFAVHPITGKVLCECGLTERAAQTLHPDYLTGCCGCPIGRAEYLDLSVQSRVYCFACERDDRPVTWRTDWQDEICGACGLTSAQAGQPGSWTVHWRTARSVRISATSCGGACGAAVEARRDEHGVLALIKNSAHGRVKPKRRTARSGAAADRHTPSAPVPTNRKSLADKETP